ncbi:MAG: asparaginase [Moraxellaceae bacterium]|nr:asparaginase [Moraxellaceae bacterium]
MPTPTAPVPTKLPKVALLGTGGTISSIGRGKMDLTNYGDTGNILHAEEIAAAVPEIFQHAEIVPVRFRNMPAIEITPADWLALNAKLHEVAEATPDLAGIVVTHGTASLEETAYFLNLALKIDVPVVLVGAQRPFSAISSDAQLNLINAVRVAASPESRGRGVLVVLNDEIQAAREVTKTDTYRLQSFQSPGLGALGYADADRVCFYRTPVRRHTTGTPYDVRGLSSLPRVDVVTSYVGADGVLIDAVVQAGARGIVAAGFAPGCGAPAETAALRRALDRRVTVVQAARAQAGRVDARDRVRAAGFVAGDNLPAHKARILLMMALTRSEDPAEIQQAFWDY